MFMFIGLFHAHHHLVKQDIFDLQAFKLCLLHSHITQASSHAFFTLYHLFASTKTQELVKDHLYILQSKAQVKELASLQ